jgi:signal transduction histidine kinase
MPSEEGPREAKPTTAISVRLVDKVLSRSVAVVGLVFAAQTLPWLLPQLDEADPAWLWIVVPAIGLSLLLCTVLSFANVGVRAAHGTVSVVYAFTLVTWPLAILPGAEVFAGPHWLYYLITVATSTAAIAYPTIAATAYLIVASAAYLVIRTTPAGGGADWMLATLESVYALILGGAVMIIVTMLRFAAAGVDAAQQTALDRYAHAVRHHAAEVERARVDSIVHDGVLTTLLAAGRAESADAKRLATSMAGSAIAQMRAASDASPGPEGDVRLTALVDRLSDAGIELGGDMEFRIGSIGTRSIPAEPAEAVFSAAVQAMINSLQHAGEGVERWVSVRGVTGGVELEVGDTGSGFELAEVPVERMGVRVSILERLASVGGRSTIRSAPGAGTVVSIRWPDPGGAS